MCVCMYTYIEVFAMEDIHTYVHVKLLKLAV